MSKWTGLWEKSGVLIIVFHKNLSPVRLLKKSPVHLLISSKFSNFTLSSFQSFHCAFFFSKIQTIIFLSKNLTNLSPVHLLEKKKPSPFISYSFLCKSAFLLNSFLLLQKFLLFQFLFIFDANLPFSCQKIC